MEDFWKRALLIGVPTTIGMFLIFSLYKETINDFISANPNYYNLIIAAGLFIVSLFLIASNKFLYQLDENSNNVTIKHSYTFLNKEFKRLFEEKNISDTVEKYLDEQLINQINTKLSNVEALEKGVVANLQQKVKEETRQYLDSISQEELVKSLERDRNNQHFFNDLEREAKSASQLKMVMINLFVVATLAFIGFSIIQPRNFSIETYLPVFGLYFSLGAFMLYVIRTAHFRTSVLLAIQEDQRNYYTFEGYLMKYKKDKDLNEHDVEVIRMILTNRSEREHKANHPYEVILKGIEGSNIQFRGGKIEFGKKSKET